MYGTVVRCRVKPEMIQKLLDYEAMIKTLGMKDFIAEFTLSTEEDPNLCYKLINFENKESYDAVAQMPAWNERYKQLLDMLDGPPEWHDG